MKRGAPPTRLGAEIVDDREVDEMTLKAARQLLDCAAAYIPQTLPGRPSGYAQPEQVAHAFETLRDGRDVPDDDRHVARLISDWRVEASRVEATNAARLATLAGLAVALSGVAKRLPEGDERIEEIQQIQSRLARGISRYGQAGETMPIDRGEIRAWAMRSTRDYATMPREWRSL